jgi:hypothetical protein
MSPGLAWRLLLDTGLGVLLGLAWRLLLVLAWVC